MQGFSVDTTLELDDWRAYQRAFQRHVTVDRHPLRTFLLVLIASLLLGFLGAAWLQISHRRLHVPEIIIGMLIAFLAVLLRTRMVTRAAQPSTDGGILGAVHYEFTAEGLRLQRAATTAQMRWSALRDVSITPQHLFLWIDHIAAHIVPVRDLPAPLTAESAAALIRSWVGAAPSGADAGTIAPGTAAASGTANGTATPGALVGAAISPAGGAVGGARASSLTASLLDAWRITTFRRCPEGVAVHPGVTVLLGLMAIALWILLDGWARDQPAEYSPIGFSGIATYALAALAVAWIMAARTEPPSPIRSTVWLVALLAPWVVLGTWLASFTDPPWLELILALTVLVSVAQAAHALRAIRGESQGRAVLGGLGLAVLLWMMTGAAFVNASLWYTPDPEETAEGPNADVEASLYEQPARIAASLAAVAPHSGPAPQAYLLGFAGVGEQRVFSEEIQLASKVLGNRYGSAPRSLLLINDQRDLDSHPLATVTALERALHGLAARMNPQEDILFLVLSSHGSQDATIAVSNGGMELNPLDADTLADALQESGIRYKVIIISACYAGSFIPALSDENTIILAAAAADRTSFGCGSDRDLTYFGEAFFRDALPKTTSLRQAFTLAADALARRERAEHETPSKPQAYYGAAISARLEAMEKAATPP